MSQSPDKEGAHEAPELRILVVDDEPTLRLGFAYALSGSSTIVETAPNGRAALDRLARDPFDIVILDLRMPELDGIAVIKTLRHRGSKIPVVLCSAALTPKAAINAIRHGVVDFLLKPVKPTDLREIIDHVLYNGVDAQSRALKAAREGNAEMAVQILEEACEPDTQSASWLKVFRSIRDHGASGDMIAPEETITPDLDKLAFNSPHKP